MSTASSRDAGRSGAAGDRERARRRCWCCEAGEIGAERVVELARDVALEAADDVAFGEAFGGAAGGVGAGAGAVVQPADGDHVQRLVGLAVTATIESVARGASGAGGDRGGGAEAREGGFALQPVDGLAGGDQQLARVHGADAEQAGRARGSDAGEAVELALELSDLEVEVADTPGEAAQRKLGRLGRFAESCQIGPQLAAERRFAGPRLASLELGAELVGGGDDQ